MLDIALAIEYREVCLCDVIRIRTGCYVLLLDSESFKRTLAVFGSRYWLSSPAKIEGIRLDDKAGGLSTIAAAGPIGISAGVEKFCLHQMLLFVTIDLGTFRLTGYAGNRPYPDTHVMSRV
jgi:hypothetical protein